VILEEKAGLNIPWLSVNPDNSAEIFASVSYAPASVGKLLGFFNISRLIELTCADTKSLPAEVSAR
jgi:hypothetical protein